MQNKRLVVILSLIIILSVFPVVAFGSDFSDMPSNWSRPVLEKAIVNGLLKGHDGRIRPNDSLTRAEMATVVNRAFNAVEKASLSEFTDVSDDKWYYEEMAKALAMKTFVGDENKLRPEENITRQEAFVVLGRALQISEKDHARLDGFSDKNDISDWAKDEVAGLVKAGYVAGANSKINPKADITRAEFAKIMVLGHDKIYNNETGVTYKDLQEAIDKAGQGETILLRGSVGFQDKESDYTIYYINTDNIAIRGLDTGDNKAKLYGTLVIKADGVTIDNLSIQNRGAYEGESTPNVSAIYIYADSATISNNHITNGIGDKSGIANGMQIMRKSDIINANTSDYKIEGNTILDYNKTFENYTSTGIFIVENTYSATVGENFYSIKLDDYAISSKNTFSNNETDYWHIDYTAFVGSDNIDTDIYFTRYARIDSLIRFELETRRGYPGVGIYLVQDITLDQDIVLSKDVSLTGPGVITIGQGGSLTIEEGSSLTLSDPSKINGPVSGDLKYTKK